MGSEKVCTLAEKFEKLVTIEEIDKVKFDPSKKHGVVMGQSSNWPGAKFEQDGRIYDIHHKWLNESAAPSGKKSLREDATAKLVEKAEATLVAATAEMQKAGTLHRAKGTNASRQANQKAIDAYDSAVAELTRLKA